MAEQKKDVPIDDGEIDSVKVERRTRDTELPETQIGNQFVTSEASNDAVQTVDDENVQTPQFQPLTKSEIDHRPVRDISRLKEVKVVVSAELGRTQLPIEQLLSLTDGSVIELKRNVDAPIELIAQGIPLGNGEVVVVDDCFAIRIKEIYSNS